MTRHLRRILPAIALAATVALGGCVVEPEDTSFEDVGSFGWPAKIGTTMHYKVASSTPNNGDSTLTARVSEGKGEFENMYRLQTATETTETPVYGQVHFLPSRDTLLIERSITHENGLYARYALVAPLERGESWTAAYHLDANGMETDSAMMRATVIERYSYWKLEGKSYSNVVAVKYTPTEQSGDRFEWIRFYAKDVGLILTVRNVYPRSTHSTQTPPTEIDRVILTETSAVQ